MPMSFGSFFFWKIWIYAVFIPIGFWIYDGLTLKKKFEAKWGKDNSITV